MDIEHREDKFKESNKKLQILKYWNSFSSKRKKVIKSEKEDRRYVKLIPEIMELSSKSNSFLELGCGSASLRNIHPNYIGISISLKDLLSIKSKDSGFNGVCCDAEALPFKDKSIDFIFENAFLEHPLHPERVLDECCRVIKNGGIIYHNSAWFVRKWTSIGIPVKSFKNYGFNGKLYKVIFKFVDNLFFRALSIVPKRIIRELRFLYSKRLFPFEYNRLKPNFSLNIGVDEDACSSIEPQCLFLFYKSSGFNLLNGKNFLKRIFHKGNPVIVRR